ncbi:MAG: type II 3-dehydroquinate dehydratase [Proteobacteria bacterium]|nr:type II 3-dehydroquinate dehydratase [Pseudomonadota bacterium]
MIKILLIHGPNLGLLGRREPKIYGHETQEDLLERVRRECTPEKYEVELVQSNHEGVVLDVLNQLVRDFHAGSSPVGGILINAGAWTHTSIALRDALSMVQETGLPVIEIHLSNTAARETFRHMSMVAPVVTGCVAGLGAAGYTAAARAIIELIQANSKHRSKR